MYSHTITGIRQIRKNDKMLGIVSILFLYLFSATVISPNFFPIMFSHSKWIGCL